MFCILQDCNLLNCHNCFPVKKCSYNHKWCLENGCCDEILDEEDIKFLNFCNYNEKILVTGCCGFIGSHMCEFLLKKNYKVIGLDNLNSYYDVNIKYKNLDILKKYDNFLFTYGDICDTDIISKTKPYKIIHLASMAGVRFSIENPQEYVKNNIQGFIHILEESVKNNVTSIVYASSSSVYGLNSKVPFNEDDKIESCNSQYACSKMAMELFAKTYTQLYNISCIGLRFFTVYGPRGRPDMAPYKFLKNIIDDKPLKKFGDGNGESWL